MLKLYLRYEISATKHDIKMSCLVALISYLKYKFMACVKKDLDLGITVHLQTNQMITFISLIHTKCIFS